MHVPFPFTVTRGTVESASNDAWVVGLIEQILFTMPGERVNRPTFGCGVQALVFQGNSAQAAVASEFLVQSALQRDLTGIAQITSLSTLVEGAALIVTIEYVNLINNSSGRASFKLHNR